MKILNFSKKFKVSLMVCLCALMAYPMSTYASTNQNGQGNKSGQVVINGHVITDSTTLSLMNKFPNLKKDLQEKTTGKLVATSETYFKYTPKSNLSGTKKIYNSSTKLENDYTITKYTKQQYENEIKNNSIIKNNSAINTNSVIGPQVGGLVSWMRMLVEVYDGTNCDYQAYNFCSWLTTPLCTGTDGIGISLSAGLIVANNGYRESEYEYALSPELYDQTCGGTRSDVAIDSQGNGVLAQYKIQTYFGGVLGGGQAGSINDFMISTGVNYNGNGVDKGWITGQYLHTQVALGGIGMDGYGVPSVSVGLSTDRDSGSVSVER